MDWDSMAFNQRFHNMQRIKHSLPIMSFLLLSVSFIEAWYDDHLFNHLFIFVIPIHIVLFICFVVLLVISVRRVMKEKDCSSFFQPTCFSAAGCADRLFPFRDARVKYELNRFEADRLQIIRMIQSDQLRPKDAVGNVALPAGSERLSSDGEVFVYQNDENGQVIGFGFQGHAVRFSRIDLLLRRRRTDTGKRVRPPDHANRQAKRKQVLC